jgi:dienelactone hydrolase
MTEAQIIEKDHALLDELGRRMHHAVSQTPDYKPWIPEDRETIVAAVKECLGIREQWIPGLSIEATGQVDYGTIAVRLLAGESWPGAACTAHLYLPDSQEPLPLVMIACGHGRGGKQSPGYSRMAWQLAHQGFAVLIMDNIGQGEREPMGHRAPVAPFRCGTSVQGLIVMETMGWLRWAQEQKEFDRNRIAAIGNSGGGTLSLFFGALCADELAALSSSGYPSTFDFIAAKEKNHCHCNILPGIVGRLHMWQIYGVFAPKPLYLFQGRSDHLFPEDLFFHVWRKVNTVYRQFDAESNFRARSFPEEGHSWTDERRDSLTVFLSESLGLDPELKAVEYPEDMPGNCLESWPANALTTDALAAQLTGVPARENEDLASIYLPGLGRDRNTRAIRGPIRQIAAQMQAFLAPEWRLEIAIPGGSETR